MASKYNAHIPDDLAVYKLFTLLTGQLLSYPIKTHVLRLAYEAIRISCWFVS